MPAFKFEALNAEGKTTTGLLDADNAKAARAQLRAQALVPMEVTQVAASGTGAKSAFNTKRRVFSSSTLSVWKATGGLGQQRPAAGAWIDSAFR